MKKEDDIYHSIDNLAGILQYTMNKNGEMIKLEEELNIIEKYMELQNLRTGGRFTYTTNFSPEVLDCSIIKFIIQPIVENCVLHAFGERKTDCIICITAEINGDKLLLRVIDNGIGMGSEQLNRFFSSKTSNVDIQEHLGLSTIDERIRLQFGNSFGLSIDSDEGGTTILYLLPLIRD